MYLPPLPVGVTTVTGVRLYSDEARTADEQIVPVSLVDGQWYVDTLNIGAGRWWATVDAQQGVTPYAYPLIDPLDLPEDDRLVVSPEALAVEMQMPLPLSVSQRAVLRTAILNAQADVVAYLGQPILPRQYVQRNVWPVGADWYLTEHGNAPIVKIISAVEEIDPYGTPLGTFTVTYLAGIDARVEEEYAPIRRYLIAHAANSPEATRLWRAVVNPAKIIKSASTAGQSVGYEVPTLGGGGAAGSGNPGALPTLASLDTWRAAGRRVWQGPTQFGVRYGV